MTWYEVYLKDISKKKNLTNYVIDKIKNKKVLINLIKKYSANQNIVEAGSGTGVISTYMASLGFKVTSFDIDDQILKLSKKIANEYQRINKIGIPSTQFVLFVNCCLKVIIYLIVAGITS